MTRQGSVLILVLISMTALMVLCTRQWFAATHMLDAVIQKEHYEQRFWLAQGLMECSIAFCIHQWHKVQEYSDHTRQKTRTLQIHHGLNDNNAVLHLYKQSPESVRLELVVGQDTTKKMTHCCLLTTYTQEMRYIISEWGCESVVNDSHPHITVLGVI